MSAPETEQADARARAVREALIGASIAGRYVLRGVVGHGGMGAVYEAEQLGLGKPVAIKFVDPEFATDERVVSRFAREARAMSKLESVHIVTVFDAGTHDGRPYLVMELLRGEDLGQRLRRQTRLPLSEAMHIIAQVLKGLAKAHAAGIVHRDLKPDNVFLVNSDADPLFAKIVDFGVSKIERPRNATTPLALTGRGTVLGTPFYMCPEQAQAMPDVDGRADLYSIGAILFECLTGRPPHTGETYEQIILSICMRDAPDVRAIDPSLPPAVAAFVSRALSRDRIQRFPSAERMLAAIHEIAPDEKKRVPLDPVSSETLLSPGVDPTSPPSSPTPTPTPTPTPVNATRLVGAFDDPSMIRPHSAGDRTTPHGTPTAWAAHGTQAARAASPAVSPKPAAARLLPASAERHGDGHGDAKTAAPMATIPGLPSRRIRSRTKVALTAGVALLLGIGAMLAMIRLLDKSAGPNVSVSTSTSIGQLASQAAPALRPDPPVVTSAATITSAPTPNAAAVASTARPPSSVRTTAPPGTPTTTSAAKAKPLDIARDLP